MKSLRILALMLAFGAFSMCSLPAHAQQEVDPDHFDQAIAASRPVRAPKLQSHHTAAIAPRQTARKTASGSSRKARQPQNTRLASSGKDILGE